MFCFATPHNRGVLLFKIIILNMCKMQNKTTTPVRAKKGRFSTYFANRTPKDFSFLRKHCGNMVTRPTEFGTYLCTMIVPHTGQGAFAYGRTFRHAYANMIKNFNLKYN